MKWLLRRCIACGRYTLQTECPNCGSGVRIPHPAKFSIDDKYVRYRRISGSVADRHLEDRNTTRL